MEEDAIRSVYIAGPYMAQTPELVELNVRRACAVGYLAAVVHGLHPQVPHASGWFGVLGSPTEADGSLTRHRAIRWTTDLARQVSRSGGDLWIISADDGSLSDGTRLDLEAFRSQGLSVSQKIRLRPWSTWAEILIRELPHGAPTDMHLKACGLR